MQRTQLAAKPPEDSLEGLRASGSAEGGTPAAGLPKAPLLPLPFPMAPTGAEIGGLPRACIDKRPLAKDLEVSTRQETRPGLFFFFPAGWFISHKSWKAPAGQLLQLFRSWAEHEGHLAPHDFPLARVKRVQRGVLSTARGP